MRRQALRAVTALAVLLGGIGTVLAPAAGAQTGYPPGPCTATIGSQDAGAHAVGTSFTVVLSPTCAFSAGALVNIVVNGQAIGTKAASANGTVTVNVTVASATQLVINDPVTVAGQCGTNTIVATGPSAAAGGATVTQTATFTVLCPTGVAVPTPVARGRVAFTGANVLRWGAVALVLLAVGALLVVADRRRAKARS